MSVSINHRPYDSSDLKELADNVFDWAEGWDDMVWYIRNIARYDADFAKDEIEPLAHDIEKLSEDDKPFTFDYRKIYEYISGKPCSDCPPPEGLQSHGLNPREVAEKWLSSLNFPASKKKILSELKNNRAPLHIVRIIQKVDDKEFENVGSFFEEVGDKTWDHD